MWLLLKYTLLYAAVLTLVAMGGMFSERSGVINIALEGIMVVGGLMGVVAINLLNAWGVPVFLAVILAVLASAVAGLAYSSLLAFSAINLKADQTIGGTALNLLATALAMVIAKRINGSDSPKIVYSTNTNASFNSSHFSFQIGPLTLNWFLVITLVCIALAWFILYRSRFGLRLMACGEHPQAADSVGINVYKMRYAGVTISGALAGMGGFVYAMTTANCSSNGDVAGFGFLALAVMIFGNWKPLNIAGASLLFGLFKCIAAAYASIDINGDGVFLLADIGISAHLYRMLPYLITLLVLAFTSKKSRAPKAEGIPYDKGSR